MPEGCKGVHLTISTAANDNCMWAIHLVKILLLLCFHTEEIDGLYYKWDVLVNYNHLWIEEASNVVHECRIDQFW